MEQKTIFITSFHGLVSRVLQSGVLDYLLADETVRVVLLVPDFKKDYFCEAFSKYKGVVVEGVDIGRFPRRTYIFHQFSFALLHTKTMKLIRRSHRGYLNAPHKYLLVDALAGSIGRFKWGRRLFRALNYYFAGPKLFTKYFNKYNPSLVFSTDSKHMLDTALLIEAKKRGIKTTSMVRSWDYLTAKGIVRVQSDKMIVHNEIIKEEAIKYADMKPENIVVVGIPHFDPYTNEARSTKKEFYKRIKADLQKRILLYAPIGSKFGDTDGEILDLLGKAIEDGTLPSDLQILVRLPPGDTIELSGLHTRHSILFDEPGKTFGNRNRKANEMTYDDLTHLADSLHWSDIVLTGPSTMAIDAAAFDTPAIFFAFNGRKELPYYEGVQHYYDFLHLQNVIKTKGVSLAHTPDELFARIHHYLNNPASDRVERSRLVKEQCFLLDGKSSKRLAEFMLSD